MSTCGEEPDRACYNDPNLGFYYKSDFHRLRMMGERARRLIEKFGLDYLPREFNAIIDERHMYMSRQILFACRTSEDVRRIGEIGDFYCLTGIMPSHEKIHLGTLAVVESMKAFQKKAKLTIILVADLEALATRGIPLDIGRKYALEYHIPTYIALGLNPDKTIFYFQSENVDLQKIAFDAAKEITLSEFRAVYGDANPPRIVSVLHQIGDMLFPQLVEPMYGIIPVGLDQDPHIRLCRDYLKRTKVYNFKPIVGVYIRDVPSLDGRGKMSKSEPHKAIFIPEDDDKMLRRKIFKAFSGGAPSLEEQRRRGADLSKDVPYKILEFILKDEKQLHKIARDYSTGKMISGEIKEFLFEYLRSFMEDFKEKLEQARELVRANDIVLIRSKEDLKAII